MSMSDTAEDWFYKGNKPYKHQFTHIKGLDCGHYHVYETMDSGFIDCYACLKIMAEIPEIREEVYVATNKIRDNEKNREKQLRENRIKKLSKDAKHGFCSCGFPFVERRTHKSPVRTFLGCTDYPTCKNTKSFTNAKQQQQ